MINGSYQAVVALGSSLCFPPITLAGRKMGHFQRMAGIPRGRHLFLLVWQTDKDTRRRHGQGLADAVWVGMRPGDYILGLGLFFLNQIMLI